MHFLGNTGESTMHQLVGLSIQTHRDTQFNQDYVLVRNFAVATVSTSTVKYLDQY